MFGYLLLLCLVPVFGGEYNSVGCYDYLKSVRLGNNCDLETNCIMFLPNDVREAECINNRYSHEDGDLSIPREKVVEFENPKFLANPQSQPDVTSKMVIKLSDQSFVFKDVVYRPDCKPLTFHDEPDTTYPVFESCQYFFSVNGSDRIAHLMKCPNGTVYHHGGGCVQTDVIPSDCRRDNICSPFLDPEMVQIDGEEYFRYFTVLFDKMCKPRKYLSAAEAGLRFPSMSFCDEYYTLGRNGEAVHKFCGAKQVFNRFTLQCEENIPCYQYYHMCNEGV